MTFYLYRPFYLYRNRASRVIAKHEKQERSPRPGFFLSLSLFLDERQNSWRINLSPLCAFRRAIFPQLFVARLSDYHAGISRPAGIPF